MLHRSSVAMITLALLVPSLLFAAVSTNYTEPIDSMNSGGGEGAKSNNYQLNDTIGEPIAGTSTTSNYTLQSGYRSNSTDPSISISCQNTLSLGTVNLGSAATAEALCTVFTDSDVGYTLHWRIPSGSGGTNTGSLVSQFNTTIEPLSPAIADTPEAFTSVSAADARFAARVSSTSTDADSEWGTDSVSEKWLNISTLGRSIVSRLSQTASEGSTEKVQIKVIAGSSSNKTAGTYRVVVLMTAYAN
jgi:hypothetical protein